MPKLSSKNKPRKRHRAGLVMVAVYKLAGALLFAAVGFGALHLVGKDVEDVITDLAAALRFNPESKLVNFVLDRVSLLDDPMLRRIGLAAYCYAGLGILEGIGLFLEKAWGEYLTLIITASFLPLEIIEIMRRLTWIRVVLFAANVLVLLYLAWVVIERGALRRREMLARKSGA